MIYDILPVNNYQGNSSNTTFDFDFYIEDGTQLNVYHFDKDNVKRLLIENQDYSINEVKNKSGSYITFPISGSNYTVLKDDEKISLELYLPIAQETQYNNSSLLNLEALEYSLDYLTRLIQIYARKIHLCVKVEECSENTPEELIDTINQQSINVVNNANLVQNIYNSVSEMNTQIDGIYSDILENGDKFEAIDTLISTCNSLEENKADLDLSNLTDGLANVICTQKPTTESSASDNMPVVLVENSINGNSWYRVYSDGWCEQGGIILSPTQAAVAISYIKNFPDVNYFVSVNISGLHSESCYSPNVTVKALDSCVAVGRFAAGQTRNLEWRAFGYIR